LCGRHERRILAARRQDCTVLKGAYEEQTHQDKRHAEELKAAADDLLSRLDQ
jgi:hypothetical protein